MVKVTVIANPASGGAASFDALRPALEAVGAEVVVAPEGRGGARDAARRAAREGAEVVVAAGGDGTVREVASGLLLEKRSATLGILPVGTGNDLARALELPLEPEVALEVVLGGRVRAIDAMEILPGGSLGTDRPRTRHAVNALAAGFSGEIADRLTGDAKQRWGPLAYLMGLVQALPDRAPHEVTLTLDSSETLHVEAFNVIIANGRSVAGGHVVAPEASLDDGLLDVIVIRHATLVELSALAARFALGSYLDSELVTFRRVHHLRITCESALLFNIDGEVDVAFGLEVRILPQALKVRVA